VQPILALSVVGLLATGHRMLGEPVGRRSLIAVAGILGGIALLALEAPTGTPRSAGVLPVLTLVGLGALSLVRCPRAWQCGLGELPRARAGTAYVVLALATTLLDGALGRGPGGSRRPGSP